MNSMPDLTVRTLGLSLPNPFVIGSGPPGTNANVIAKAFDEGWGAVIAKTVCLDHRRIVNVSPRYARMRAPSGAASGGGGGSGGSREIIGWENIELISDRPFDVWLEEFRRLKNDYPDRVLIASIMEEFREDAWAEIIGRVQETGVDGLELNFSCPHGLPEQRMGSAMGQDPAVLEEVCSWVNTHATVPVWAKLTPNVTDIAACGSACLRGGVDGLSAINTILCIMGVNLETLRPEPTVEGYSTPGGYSSIAVRPIALRMTMELARMQREEFLGASLSAIGGIESGEDAAQFILMGAHTVQVCTGVMKHGYGLVGTMLNGLKAFMESKGFERLDDFRGMALQHITTHAELVRLQSEARFRERGDSGTVRGDGDWRGDRFTEQSESLAGN